MKDAPCSPVATRPALIAGAGILLLGLASLGVQAQEAKPPAAAAPRSWAVATADTIMRRYPDYRTAYFKPWTYVHGYVLYGFEMLYRSTGDKKYFDYMKRYIDQIVDEKGDLHYIDRKTGKVVGTLGQMGENGGSFFGVHMEATDSRGNLYTGEVFAGERVQRFVPADSPRGKLLEQLARTPN